MNGEIGKRIVARRRQKRLTQRELAEQVNASQATISRLERVTEPAPRDARLLARVAQALDCQLSDILPQGDLEVVRPSPTSDHFYAFCPNAFCNENSFTRNAGTGQLVVTWKSGTNYSLERFDEINFCFACGTDLVKECPSCRQKLEHAGTRFCQFCGSKVTERPTAEEWKAMSDQIGKAVDVPEDDIPF